MTQKNKQDTLPITSSTCLETNNDQLACQDEEGPNESTTESKKNTNASSSVAFSDVKSEHYSPRDKADIDMPEVMIAKK